jgi:hypothetical protein
MFNFARRPLLSSIVTRVRTHKLLDDCFSLSLRLRDHHQTKKTGCDQDATALPHQRGISAGNRHRDKCHKPALAIRSRGSGRRMAISHAVFDRILPKAQVHAQVQAVQPLQYFFGAAACDFSHRSARTTTRRGAGRRCLFGAEPMVRIHLPPAGSQVRTRPHGFGNLRYRGSPRIEDPTVQAEILREVQILLTAFVVVLKPQPWDQPTSRHSAPVPVKGRRSILGKRAERERCGREIAQ